MSVDSTTNVLDIISVGHSFTGPVGSVVFETGGNSETSNMVVYMGIDGSACFPNPCGETKFGKCIANPLLDGDYGSFHCQSCPSSPCMHNGVCAEHSATFQCDCSGTGFSGLRCEIPGDPQMVQWDLASGNVEYDANVDHTIRVQIPGADNDWYIFWVRGCVCVFEFSNVALMFYSCVYVCVLHV